jgi:hypothetical protein
MSRGSLLDINVAQTQSDHQYLLAHLVRELTLHWVSSQPYSRLLVAHLAPELILRWVSSQLFSRLLVIVLWIKQRLLPAS